MELDPGRQTTSHQRRGAHQRELTRRRPVSRERQRVDLHAALPEGLVVAGTDGETLEVAPSQLRERVQVNAPLMRSERADG